jgi:glucosamine kinase
MSTVLGIDGGGTKTIAATVDETGAVVSLVLAAGLDPTRAEDAEAELDNFLLSLVPADAVAPVAATVGLPFHGEVAAITTMQHDRVGQRLGAAARACNDVEVAHLGAFAGGDGVLVLAGTGSMAWAKGPSGTARVGGFGDLIGDEGSAFWIGQKAVNLLSQEADGRRPASAFGNGLLEALAIDQHGLIDWVYGQPNPRAGIASIARHVSALAAAGDADATEILRGAAAELASAARAAARAAGLVAPFALSTAGSVFLDDVVRAELARGLDTEPAPGLLPPVGGAILDAARRAGWAVDPAWISRLGDELKEKGAA